jgi:serine/threonine-protein kinase
VVGDHYRLCRLLGEGSMGRVWEATHTSTHERVALKFLKGCKDEDRRRFLREVRAGTAVDHPNVIGVHDFIELADGSLVIVMDLLQGETLGAVLLREKRIALPALAAILLRVVSALEAAHVLGIVHRDLKPDNVFLCTGGASAAEVKVLDFGVAKLTATEGIAARTQALTGTGSMLGTPYYMSPEQVFSEKDLDERADVWSLGVVMYECLAGVRPTEAETVGRVLKRIMVAEFDPIASHCADIPADVASLIGRMLSAARDDRPSLADVRAILEHHTAEGIPSFSGDVRAEVFDPRAGTVARADTNSAMWVLSARRSGARKRAVVAVVAVAVLGGTYAVRERGFGKNETPAGSAVTSATSVPIPMPSTTARASAEAPALLPSTVAVPEVAPKTSRAPATENANVKAIAIATATGPRAAAVSKTSCDVGEVPSEGHCCPRGHVWQSGRCQRPFATSF